MSGKTIFIIIATILVTIVLMNNTDEMELWLFGVSKIPKLAVLGTMLGIGFILGFIAGRPKNKVAPAQENHEEEIEEEPATLEKRSRLSDEDRDYIS